MSNGSYTITVVPFSCCIQIQIVLFNASKISNFFHRFMNSQIPSRSLLPHLTFLCKHGSRLRKAWSNLQFERNRTPAETLVSTHAAGCEKKAAHITCPKSIQPSTSKGRKWPAASFLRSIFVAHNMTAMLMKSELFAMWRPMQFLRPKPYEKCP